MSSRRHYPPQSLQGKPAGLFRCLSAMVYDALLIVGCMIALGFLAVVLNRAEPIREGWKSVLLSVAMFALWAGFYAYFVSRQGQTLGMRAWKLLLVGERGRVPSFARVLWRWTLAVTMLLLPFAVLWQSGVIAPTAPPAVWAALLLPVTAAYLWAYLRQDRRTLIDLGSRTRLLQVEENPYPKIRRKKNAS